MNTNRLNVYVMVLASLTLIGCSMDVNLLNKTTLGSVGGDGPTTTLPMGNYALQKNKTIGKNAWIGLDGLANVTHGGMIDNAGNTTFVGEQAVYEYDANGAEIRKVDLPTSGGYQNWVGERTAMVRTSSGDLYLLSRVMPGAVYDWGLLKITPSGTVTKIQLSGGSYTSDGGYDFTLVTPTSGPEELHVLPNIMSGSSLVDNWVEVYDLSGNFVRSYAAAEAKRFTYIAQNPVDKKTYLLADNGADTVYVYNENGTLARSFDLDPTLYDAFTLKFDSSGYMYVADQGDSSITGGDPNRGISVFDVTGVPTVVRTMRGSVSHPLSTTSFAVSPNGNMIAAFNSANGQFNSYDEQWNLSGSSYTFTKLLSSKGSGDADFDCSGSFGALVLDKDENFYVDDNKNRRVKVYSMDGTFKYAFSSDDASVTFWGEHFVTMTSADKVITGGYEYSYGATAKVYFAVREKTGTQISTAVADFTSVNGLPKFIGIDSDDQMWFADYSNFFRVNLSGTITKTIDFAGNPASLGVTAVIAPQVAGDRLYYLGGDLSLNAYDINTETYEQLVTSTQYTAAGLFAVIPSGTLQLLSGGKIAVSAIATDMTTRLYVVLDPAANYSVVTKVNSADQTAFGTMIWTSLGLWSKGTYDRFYRWDLH